MFYEKELDFLIKTFEKCGLPVKVMPLKEFVDTQDVTDNVLYKLTDVLGLHYIFLLLPDHKEPMLLLIGPYEIGDSLGDNPTLMAMLDIFCQTIWGGKSSYKEVVIDGELKNSFSSFSWEKDSEEEYIFSYKMRQLESRYAYENEIISAVSQGHAHKADMFFPISENFIFDNRLTDSVRNAKNYLIICNTLCRKAAETGGVHPFYLDKLSSDYAQKIEFLKNTSGSIQLLRDMFKDYCNLVKKHNTKVYSSLVQSVILYIESNLDSNLNLSTLASLHNVNPSYLSTLFKKETDTTLTAFVNKKRVEKAEHLLRNGNLQVQAVAQSCGFLDVQYFSKIFKKYTGDSPKKYREKTIQGVRK